MMARIGSEHTAHDTPDSPSDQLRLRMLNGVLWTLAIAAGITTLLAVPMEFKRGNYTTAWFYIGLYGLNLSAALLRPLGYSIRAAAFPVSLFLLGLNQLLLLGTGSDAVVFLFAAVVFTGVFLGLRAGLVMFGVILLGMAGSAGWFLYGSGEAPPDLLEFSKDPLIWITNTSVLLFLALTSLLTHSSLLRGLSASANESETLVRELRAEIGAREQAEQRVNASQKLLQDVLAATTEVAIIAGEKDGAITLFNRGAERMLGYSEEEITGRATPLLFHLESEIQERADELSRELGHPVDGFRVFVEMADRHGAESREWTYVRKDGSRLTVSLVITPLRGDDNEVTGYLGIATDISERVATEQALRQEKLFSERLLDSLPGIFYLYDSEFRLRRWNRNHEAALGYSSQELQGRSGVDWFATDDERERVTEKGTTILAEGHSESIEVSLLHKDGRSLPYLLTGTRLDTPDGPVMMGVGTDITELKQAQRQVEKAAERMARQRDAIAAVAISEAVSQGDIQTVAREITESASAVLNIERTSFWLFDAAEERLECIDAYERTSGEHSAGTVLLEQDYRDEFEALKEAKYVDADDAQNDPRTAGYVENYLEPLNITSMLDAVIRAGGKNLGVLCLEHVNQPHQWEDDEIAFACQLADQAALAVANREKRLADIGLRESEEQFRYLFERNPAPMVVYERGTLRLLDVNDAFEEHYGYSRDEALGLVLTDLYPNEEKEPIRELAERIRGHAHAGEWHHLRRDGTVITIVARSHDIVFEGHDARVAVITDITDRKEAEEALVTSERRFRAFFDNAPYSIVINDFEDGSYIDGNKAFLESLGIDRDDLRRIYSSDLMALDEEQLQSFRDTLLNQGAINDIEATITDLSGKQHNIVYSSVLIEIQGKPQVLSMAVDITERRRSERAVQVNYERTQVLLALNQMTEASPDELTRFVLEQAGRLTKSSAGYVAILRDDGTHGLTYMWTSQDPPGGSALECSLTDVPVWQEMMRHGQPIVANAENAEHPWVTRMLELREPLKRHLDVPVFCEGQVVLFAGVANRAEDYGETDAQELTLLMDALWRMTERNRNERALRQARDDLERKVVERTAELRASEERFRTLFSASRDAIMVLDKTGFLDCNAETLRVFGCGTPEEFLGKHPVDFSPSTQPWGGDSRTLATQHIETALREGRAFFEWVHRRLDGTEFPAEVVLSPMVLDGKQVLQAVLRDVTQRKQAEAALERANARLQAANQELEAFSYSVSHDLRAPLRAIDGFSQALVEDYADCFDEEGRDYVNRVRNGAQRMGMLIDDMLVLSRVTRGELHLETVDLSVLAEETIAELREGEPERTVACAIQPGVTARGDRRMLSAVMSNLLGNAWKFTGRRDMAEIEFGLKTVDGEEVYFIRDNGAGFDMAYADKLFGAFQRLHSAEQFPGTGIGLATVKRIVNRHGGRIWAESEVDAGTTFYFVLGRSD